MQTVPPPPPPHVYARPDGCGWMWRDVPRIYSLSPLFGTAACQFSYPRPMTVRCCSVSVSLPSSPLLLSPFYLCVLSVSLVSLSRCLRPLPLSGPSISFFSFSLSLLSLFLSFFLFSHVVFRGACCCGVVEPAVGTARRIISPGAGSSGGAVPRGSQ